MKKRFKFKCWNCGREYTLFREITKTQTLIVGCPYCNAEAVVDLAPFRKKVKDVLKSAEGGEADIGEEWDLPEVLPTRKPDKQQTD